MEWSGVMMWCVGCGMASGVLCVSSVTHTPDRSLGSPWWRNGCARGGRECAKGGAFSAHLEDGGRAL